MPITDITATHSKAAAAQVATGSRATALLLAGEGDGDGVYADARPGVPVGRGSSRQACLVVSLLHAFCCVNNGSSILLPAFLRARE
jgi:hypothetical protein